LKASRECKIKCLGEDEDYYYVYFFGTAETARGQGLCSAIARRYQELAAKKNRPIYLEAGTEYAWKLYQKLGFDTVGEIWFGKGEVGSDGNFEDGGLGVRTWGMIWRPRD
jgi:ribosomal protein S18 acetylase RimI-like enzyme